MAEEKKEAKKKERETKPYKKKKSCPKCGTGVFLAEHKNRLACGRCGYLEVKK